MDAFEQVVSGIFFRDGYWVTQGFKVELTPEEKARIGRPTAPRWEIDLVVFKGATGELLAVECKSYLDSTGVTANDLIEPNENVSRYKLFTDDVLREVVLNRLALQLHETGLIPAGVKPKLGLVAGKMRSPADLVRLASPDQIRLKRMLSAATEDQIKRFDVFDGLVHPDLRQALLDRFRELPFELQKTIVAGSRSSKFPSVLRYGADRPEPIRKLRLQS